MSDKTPEQLQAIIDDQNEHAAELSRAIRVVGEAHGLQGSSADVVRGLTSVIRGLNQQVADYEEGEGYKAAIAELEERLAMTDNERIINLEGMVRGLKDKFKAMQG